MAAFVWGKNGEMLTPDQVERLRRSNEAAAARASDTSPVGHWSQGMARLVDGFGAYRGGLRADREEREGQEAAKSVLSALLGRADGMNMAQPAPQVSNPAQGVAGAFAGAAERSGQFPASLIRSESGGNWSALNSEGYGGRLQFGASRLADAARAGVIPAGMSGAEFSRLSPDQQQAVEQWHFSDIDRQAEQRGLSQYIGQEVAGVPITQDGIRAMAHLGGIGGASKFLQSGGQYNPADSNGTSLADYARQHGGGSAPVVPIGGAGTPPATGVSPVIAAIMQAQSNPWVAKQYGPVLEALMGQEMGRQNAVYEQRMARENAAYDREIEQQDPMYRAKLEAAQLELEQMRNPPPAKPIEVGGVLVNPQTGEVMFDSRQGGADADIPAEVQSLRWRAEQAGLEPGTQAYKDFIMNGGNRGTGVPAGFAALDAQAKAGGLVPNTPEYQAFMLGAGAGERAEATEVGKARGQAGLSLDSTVAAAERAIANIEAVRDDPALPDITGMFQGRLPPLSQAGTDLNVRINQAKGQTFLEAFESLKGAGQITEIEGQKAEQAIARLDRAQSTEAYKTALNDLVSVLRTGIDRARKRAGAKVSAPTQSSEADLLSKYGF